MRWMRRPSNSLACINMDQSWVRPLYNSRPDRCNGGLATSPGRSKPGRDDIRSKVQGEAILIATRIYQARRLE